MDIFELDILLDESRLTIRVDAITGVKPPEEIEDPESQLEYPKIEHKFHVEFKFLQLPFDQCAPSPAPSVPTLSITGPEDNRHQAIISSKTEKSGENESGLLFQNTTESLGWAEESIDFNYCEDFHIQKLLELRDFLKDGMDFNIIETKHTYVQEDPKVPSEEGKHTNSAKGQEGKDKRKKSGNKEKMDKRKESAKSKDKGKDGKGKGKSKHEETELFELPREHRTLGSCHVNLSTLLDGEFEVQQECICEEEDKTNVASKTDGSTCRGVASGKHNGSEKKKSHKGETMDKPIKGQKPTSDKKASQGKASTKGGKDDKGKGKAPKEEVVHDNEEEAMPPPPLIVKVCIKLHHWKSAKDATVTISQ